MVDLESHKGNCRAIHTGSPCQDLLVPILVTPIHQEVARGAVSKCPNEAEFTREFKKERPPTFDGTNVA